MITKNELLTEWVAALRSGEYAQGRGYLHRIEDNTYCCLGVVCDLLAKKGILSTEVDQSTDVEGGVSTTHYVTRFYNDKDPVGSNSVLPEAVSRILDWVETKDDGTELFTDDPEFTVALPDKNPPRRVSASTLNDVHGFTFPQIADLIESQLL